MAVSWNYGLRVPGAAQRRRHLSALVRCRPGTVPVYGGPGSAVHRSAKSFALHRIRDTEFGRAGATIRPQITSSDPKGLTRMRLSWAKIAIGALVVVVSFVGA